MVLLLFGFDIIFSPSKGRVWWLSTTVSFPALTRGGKKKTSRQSLSNRCIFLSKRGSIILSQIPKNQTLMIHVNSNKRLWRLLMTLHTFLQAIHQFSFGPVLLYFPQGAFAARRAPRSLTRRFTVFGVCVPFRLLELARPQKDSWSISRQLRVNIIPGVRTARWMTSTTSDSPRQNSHTASKDDFPHSESEFRQMSQVFAGWQVRSSYFCLVHWLVFDQHLVRFSS